MRTYVVLRQHLHRGARVAACAGADVLPEEAEHVGLHDGVLVLQPELQGVERVALVCSLQRYSLYELRSGLQRLLRPARTDITMAGCPDQKCAGARSVTSWSQELGESALWACYEPLLSELSAL